MPLKLLASIKDESLDTNPQGKLHLSIQSGQGGIAWALLNTSEAKYLAFESYTKTEDEDVLSKLKSSLWFTNVASTSLCLISDKFTLIPEPLFDEKVKNTYAAFNFETEDAVLSSKVRSAGCYAVFTFSEEKIKLYRNFFSAIKVMHTSVPLLESTLINDKNESIEKAYLNISPKYLELVFTKSGSLLYYNTFNYNAAEDIIYYLLFALEQMKLNPETISLQLMGDVAKGDDVYSLIHKYIRNVNFMSRIKRFEFSYRFSELPEHAYYSLFTQYLCA